METIGAFEAKTHFAALLERVAKGEKITITKRGVPTAMLVPVQEEVRRTAQQAAVRIRELRRQIRPSKMTLREMIDHGRRF
jgi:prevent-host-death family protein